MGILSDSKATALLAKIARPEILALEPYSHASWDPGLERLNANENPWRPAGDSTVAGLQRYPEPQPVSVEARLAQLYGVDPTQLLAGRGSDEAIDLLTRAFLRPGQDAAIVCPPTFGMYAVATRIQGGRVIEVPLAEDWRLDADALEAALEPAVRIVFLCTPNNPTGNTTPRAVIERLADRLADSALLVVDEAYAEFMDTPSLATELQRWPNMVVLRTLSKAYALAGARCGALIADPAIVGLLRRVLPPYSMPTPCIEAVLSALAPAALPHADARIAVLKGERERLATALAQLPDVRRVWPSEANFLLLECADVAAMLARGRAAGFLLRDFSRGARTPNCVRISVGSPDHNDRLLEGLRTP